MLCLPRQITFARNFIHIVNRRPVPAIHRLLPHLRLYAASPGSAGYVSRGYVTKKSLDGQGLKRREEKKAKRKARREKEEIEAKTPGTPAFLKAQKKIEKHAKRLAANLKGETQKEAENEGLLAHLVVEKGRALERPERRERISREQGTWKDKSRNGRGLSHEEAPKRQLDRKPTQRFNLSDNSQNFEFERGDRTPKPSFSRSDRRKDVKREGAERSSSEPFERTKREPWMVQKDAIKQKLGDEAWSPKKRLSPDTLEGIRTMHASDPDRFSTPVLADQFKVSPDVIRRVLKSKWQPDEETVQDRQERWHRRGEKIWTKQAELGVRPPKKWREMGVAKTEPGHAPKWKKGAYSRDAQEKYGEHPKHFIAQRQGASSGSVDIGRKKSFSERML